MTIYFTSITINYFAKARVLCKSLKKYNAKAVFFLAISDKIPEDIDLSKEPFDYIFNTKNLDNIENINIFYFKHNITELCTAVKPFIAKYIFESLKADKVIYLDPDIAVFNSLTELESLLDNYSMIFTPHQLIPEEQDIYIKENEILFLKKGICNLGFFGVKKDNEGLKFINWWSNRLLNYCFDDNYCVLDDLRHNGLLGLYTDQKWIDLVPSFFNNFFYIKNPGYNVCTWNLSGRNVRYINEHYSVNEKPLYFFHFSGYDSGAHINELIKSLSYYPHNNDVKLLSEWYKNQLKENDEEFFKNIDFYYTRYSSGEYISEIDRKLLHIRKDIYHLIKDPYQVTDSFCYYKWVREEYPQYYTENKKNTFMKINESKLINKYFPKNSLRRKIIKNILLFLKKCIRWRIYV